MATDTPHPARWERRKKSRPQELAAAALELFVERGFAATRLEDIAARAGVSKGTLYLYFDSKDALFKEVVRAGIVPALAEAEETAAGFEGSTAELLRRFVQRWWTLIGTSPIGGIPKLILSEARNFPELARFYHDEVIVRGKGLLRRTIARGIAQGEFRQCDPRIATEALIGPMLLTVLWKHSFGMCVAQELDPQEALIGAVDIVLAGLRKDPDIRHD